ncbi:MAG: hypothetical protein ACLP29_05690, partial [Dissulfurispiraceae bacterium]
LCCSTYKLTAKDRLPRRRFRFHRNRFFFPAAHRWNHGTGGLSESTDHSMALLPMSTTGKGDHEGKQQGIQTWVSQNSFVLPQGIL